MEVVLPERTPLDEEPLVLTTSVRDISVTERNSFKKCRRAWYLETLENLEPRGSITWYYPFGTGLHQGMEAFYKTHGGLLEGVPLDNALSAFEEWYQGMDEEIVNGNHGDRTSELRNELLEFKELGEGMLFNYAIYLEEEAADDFVVCAVEGDWTEEGKKLLALHNLNPPYAEEVRPILSESGRFMVPIVDPTTKLWLPDRPYLSAQLDLIVYVRKTGLRGFWVYDHKSSASAPSDRGIDMDDQCTGYGYTFWRYTGIYPRGTTFNYLIKQLPKEPRVSESTGKLSYAKDQLTTASLYRQAMIDFGHMDDKGNILSEKHGECYQSLLAYGWERFFKRHSTPRNDHEYQMFEMRLAQEYQDMVDVRDNPGEKAYPHLSQYNCPGCQVMAICKAIEDGGDYEAIIDTMFQQAPDRKA